MPITRAVAAAALGAFLACFIASPANAAGACQAFYDDTVPVPTGWGAAYDVFHAAHTPLATIDCTVSPTSLSVGLPGDTTVYVYQNAYVAKSGAYGTTNAATAAGSATLHFASTPADITAGQIVVDTTVSGAGLPLAHPTGSTPPPPTVISAGATVVSTTPTTVVISAPAIGAGVGNGDAMVFWDTAPLSASQPAAGGWLPIPGSAPLNLSSGQLSADWNYIAFLTARWNGSQWKIGCADAVCAFSSWNLQAITRQTTLVVRLTPTAPNIADDTALGATVGTISCAWSDGTPCTATFSITDPAGIYAVSGSDVIVDPMGPGVGTAGSMDTIRVTATQ